MLGDLAADDLLNAALFGNTNRENIQLKQIHSQ